MDSMLIDIYRGKKSIEVDEELRAVSAVGKKGRIKKRDLSSYDTRGAKWD